MEDIFTRCKVCGAYIRLVRTNRGRWMPCEEARRKFIRDERGGSRGLDAGGALISGFFAQEGEDYDCYVAVPHWASCTEPEAARKAPAKKKRSPVLTQTRARQSSNGVSDVEQLSLFSAGRRGCYPE